MTTSQVAATRIPSRDTGEVTTSWVPLDDLDTETVVVRTERINRQWVTQLCDTPSEWPPILVTESLEVLDGHHRVAAARRLGHDRIEALTVTGLCSAGALEAAINANASHGLTLSRAERMDLVDRLLRAATHWSDRRIAAAVRVSPTTVGKHRSIMADAAPDPSGVHNGHPERRIGRDGKAYPVGGVQMDTPEAPNRWAAVGRRIRLLFERLRASITRPLSSRRRR